MKTTLLVLLLSGAALWGQTPPGTNTDTTDSAARDDLLRRLLRGDTASNAGAATAPPPAAVTTASNQAASSVPPVVAAPLPPPATTPATPPPVIPRPVRVPDSVAATNAVPIPVVTSTEPPPVTSNVTPPAVAPIPVIPVVTAVTPPVTTPTTAQVVTNVPPPVSPPPVVPAAQPQRAVTPPPTVAVTQPTPPPATISPEDQEIAPGLIDFVGVDLNTVLEIYSKLVGRTLLRGPAVPQASITLKTQNKLTQREAVQALDTLLSMNGISLIHQGDKFIKVVPATVSSISGESFISHDGKDLPEADKYVQYILQMKHVKPSAMIPVISSFGRMPQNLLPLDDSQILIIRDYAVNVKRMLEVVKQVDVDVPLEYDSEVIPIRYAQASEIASALGSLGGGTGTAIGRAPTTGLGAGAGLGGGLGARGAGTGYQGGLNPAGGGLGTPGASALGAGARGASFTDRLRSIMGAGGGDFQILGRTKIIADERTNSLLVFASKQDMEMIKKVISQLDVVLQQVLIEAILMEVSLDDTFNLGFSYLQKTPSQPGNYFSGIGAINNSTFLNNGNFTGSGSNGVASLPGGFSYLAKFNNDFDATVTAIATDSRVNVLSRPRIQTSHAVPASLKIGNTVPYVTGTYFGGINGQASSQYQQTFVGIDLEVTPLINADGLVVMDILQDVQQLGTPTVIDGNPVPTTTQRTAKSTVSVRDHETVILGGFISTSKTKSKSGVPFLKDVPGLGFLFRSTSDSNQRVELIALIRPTVLPTPEAAALAAAHERDRLPAVKAADAEYRRDMNKKLEQSDKIKLPAERE